ncbi:MAG: 1-acyl-sn-glycerol-3-phosphate acyltransferase [Lentimicrobiaceae bacterium]
MDDNRQEKTQDPKLIDVDKVIAGKNPRLLKLLPGFIERYLKRILHQDWLNSIISKNRDKAGIEFLEAVLKGFNVNIKVLGESNFLPDKPYVVVSNHPLGGLDGMALMLVIGKINSKIAMTANDFLMHVENLKALFIPINKHGSNAENIAILDQTFSSDKVVIFFPSGLCSRKSGNKIYDLEWKKTFLSKARKFGRDIMPVHISGRNSNFFYNLANLRKRLRIKVNIEMLYLVDEMFKQDNKDIVISFGKPIPVSTFNKSRSDKSWASLLRKHVYNLEKNIDTDFSTTID